MRGGSIYANKLQKKSEASQEQIRANAQTYSILVIDKKRMKLKEAGFPQLVVDQTPKALRVDRKPDKCDKQNGKDNKYNNCPYRHK